ncbi:hypothetical protein ACJJTC_005323 [Scirpophaga incertulas]
MALWLVTGLGTAPGARGQSCHVPKEGCVATLISVDYSSAAGDKGSVTTLVCYRVLAPRLLLRVVSHQCVSGEYNDHVTTVLRPLAELNVGHRTCYKLRLTNITPLPTAVSWEPALDKEEAIRIVFVPNDFGVGSYACCEVTGKKYEVTYERKLGAPVRFPDSRARFTDKGPITKWVVPKYFFPYKNMLSNCSSTAFLGNILPLFWESCKDDNIVEKLASFDAKFGVRKT